MSLSSTKYKLIKIDFRALLFLLLAAITFSACGPGKTIRTHHAGGPVPLTGSLADWPDEIRQGEQLSEFDYFITNDDEFVYLLINFKNNRIFRNAWRYGFTVYMDGDKKFKQSFGIIYPAGILHGLAAIPGARKSYLENPGWSSMPENATLLKNLEDEMDTQVLMIGRTNPKAPIRPVPVNLNTLLAQDVALNMNRSSSAMTLQMKVPIRGTRSRQFAIDPENKTFLLGFEINPPGYEEITGESTADTSTEARQSGYDPYGRSRTPDRNQNITNRMLYHELNETYSRWVRVQLADNNR